jgi:hypothetical protein
VTATTDDDFPIERFRRLPKIVETIEWTGGETTAARLRGWVGYRDNGECRFLLPEEVAGVVEHAILWVDHSNAWVPVPVGHRVVKESDGNGFYPISPEAVAATWEPA